MEFSLPTLLNLFIIVSLLLLIVLLVSTIKSKQKQQELQTEVQQAKDRFFTNITHEFRTPLTVIQSAAQNIMRHVPPESSMHDDAANIIWYGNIVLNLINRILDTAKMVSSNPIVPEW